MDFWQSVTALGDTSTMLPVAVVIALWLWRIRHNRLAGIWCATVAGVGLTVASSKLLFMGWCLGVRSIDFTGISGHSAMAALVLPVLAGMVQQSFHRKEHPITLPIGESLAVLVGISRLALHVHSTSEVLAGLALGLCAARLFHRAANKTEARPVSRVLAASTLLLLSGLLWVPPAPTQYLLTRLAMLSSRHPMAFSRDTSTCDLQEWQVRLQGADLPEHAARTDIVGKP